MLTIRYMVDNATCFFECVVLQLRQIKEEQLPTSGCPHKQWLEKSTLVTRSKLGWFFYALKHYLINVNTNVSNARMNRPKVMRSLKSNLLFISTTPILCKIKQRSATLQHNCSYIVFQHTMFYITIKYLIDSIKSNVYAISIKIC